VPVDPEVVNLGEVKSEAEPAPARTSAQNDEPKV
jgi:hypothetical protein